MERVRQKGRERESGSLEVTQELALVLLWNASVEPDAANDAAQLVRCGPPTLQVEPNASWQADRQTQE